MNVLQIPSWYPSPQHPLTGIFIKEQIGLLARNFPEHHFGVSTWGQNDERLLLWAKDHFWNVKKIQEARALKDSEEKLLDNLHIYFSPAFTWTWNFRKGNIQAIVKQNEANLLQFQKDVGKVDLIHAQVAFPAGYVALQLSKKFSVPYAITEHMSPFPLKYFMRNGAMARRIMEPYIHSACNIAVSDGLRNKMTALSITVGKTIFNPVDSVFFVSKPKLDPGQFTFFSLGRLVPQKGMDVLLKAFTKVLEGHPDILLKIGGDGQNLNDYQTLSGELGILDKVEWLGMLTRVQVREEMQHCQAFVLASQHESMGVVFAEALACGKPVIGTQCGGRGISLMRTTAIL